MKTQDEEIKDLKQQLINMNIPILDIADSIAMVPLVGMLDSAKSQMLMEDILVHIRDKEIKVMIIDILGIATVDSAVAAHLIKITKSTQLLGCATVISGISPEVAQTIVNLGLSLSDVKTTSNLKSALSYAFDKIELEVVKKK